MKNWCAILLKTVLAALILVAGWSVLFRDNPDSRSSIDNSLESVSSARHTREADSASLLGDEPVGTLPGREPIEPPGAAERADNSLAVLRVLVRESQSGSPVDQVRVILRGEEKNLESTTDRSGAVLFSSLRPGSYEVRALGDGYADGEARAVLDRGETEGEIRLFLERGVALEGRVIGLSTGRPIAEVRLRYHDRVTGIDRQSVTSKEGLFRLHGLPAGRSPERSSLRWGKSLHFSLSNAPETVFTPLGPDRFETTLYLERGMPVSGRVLDGQGAGAAAIRILAYHRESQATKSFRYFQDFGKRVLLDGMDVFAECSTRTDSAGYFSIAALPPGIEIIIAALVPGHSRVESAPFVLDVGESLSGIVLRAVAGAKIGGTVIDQTKVPVQGALIDLYGREKNKIFSFGGSSQGKPKCLARTKTDGGGTFSFDGLDAGEFRLRVYKQGFGNCLSDWIILKKGRPAEKEFVLEKGALWATGRIVDIEGRPVPGIVVEFTPWPLPEGLSLTPFNTRSRGDGTFRVSGLWEGVRHMVRARDPGGTRTVERIDTLSKMVLPHTDGLEFKAYRAAAVSGRIEGIPPGASRLVRLLPQGDVDLRGSRSCRTADGTFSIAKVLPGTHLVEVGGESLPAKIVGQFCIEEGEHLDGLFFLYGETIELKGRVLFEPKGSPLKNVPVTLLDHTKHAARTTQNLRAGLVSETVTDNRGCFHFRGLVQGRYDLIAWDLQKGSARRSGVELLEGDETVQIDLLLTGGVRVSGKAFYGEHRRPASLALLRFIDAQWAVRSLMTDRDGRFEAFLEPGRYRCAAEFPSGRIGASVLDVPAEGKTGLELRFKNF